MDQTPSLRSGKWPGSLKANSMHRQWLVDIRESQAGSNDISIRFAGEVSLLPNTMKNAAYQHRNPIIMPTRQSYLRKWPCLRQDWGPMAPTVGIWRDISLELVHQARIDHLRIEQIMIIPLARCHKRYRMIALRHNESWSCSMVKKW